MKQLHPDGYQQALKVCEGLMAMAHQDRLRQSAGLRTVIEPPARKATPAQPKVAERQRSTGHCIRCGEDIARNPEKPLCADCYRTWSKYEDADYAEERCHHCGEKIGDIDAQAAVPWVLRSGRMMDVRQAALETNTHNTTATPAGSSPRRCSLPHRFGHQSTRGATPFAIYPDDSEH